MSLARAGFAKTLSFGVLGESKIARFMRSKGWNVLPVYEVEVNSGKGPRLFTPVCELIAPDLLLFKAGDCRWIEAKHKTAFSWHRISQRWVTGIDLRHYEDYRKVNALSDWPVWLLFLHEGGQAKDSPADSPAGLFGNTLAYLEQHENHRHNNWGKTGMVYWAIEHLKKLATLDEVNGVINANWHNT